MARILYIDDDQKLGNYTKEKIASDGHAVDWINKDSWIQAFNEVKKYTNVDWDLLILDIQYPTDEWGGIWLYNELIRSGYRGRWNDRVIVYSQYVTVGVDWKNVSDVTPQMFALRVFLDTAGIPHSNALANQNFDRATLLQKINEIIK